MGGRGAVAQRANALGGPDPAVEDRLPHRLQPSVLRHMAGQVPGGGHAGDQNLSPPRAVLLKEDSTTVRLGKLFRTFACNLCAYGGDKKELLEVRQSFKGVIRYLGVVQG